jgi:hypothetical protein
MLPMLDRTVFDAEHMNMVGENQVQLGHHGQHRDR